MFSVGASPFNSRSRQLYGGWALDGEGGAGANVWGQKQYYTMSARYNPDADERRAAREWLKAYREAVKNNPARKRAVRRQGKPYWVDAILPAMSPEQKAGIWRAWLATPFSDRKSDQITSRMLRKAPYPNARLMNTYPLLGVPRLAKLEGVQDYPAQEVRGMFRNMDDIFFGDRNARNARVGDIQRALEGAIDALNAPNDMEDQPAAQP